MDDLQLDLACVVLRIEQAQEDPDMRDYLVDRMATNDAPRLRKYLTEETLLEMRRAAH
jgi:hypothetical protein